MRHAYLSLILLTSCQTLENSLVFHPERSDGEPAVAPAKDVELRTADGAKIHARWFPQPGASRALIYCHGNAGNLEQRDYLMEQFAAKLNCNVVIFDYPGFGRSTGAPSEAGCYAAADAVYQWLALTNGFAPTKIVICGESLGGGVAVDLASKRPHQALVLIRTFTSVPDVARQTVSSAPALMANRFDSLKKIPSCRAPIFIAQADHDRVIPFEQGEQLRQACTSPVRFLRLAGLDHNDPLPASFYREFCEFLNAKAE